MVLVIKKPLSHIRKIVVVIGVIDLLLAISDSRSVGRFFLLASFSNTFRLLPEDIIDTYCAKFTNSTSSRLCNQYNRILNGPPVQEPMSISHSKALPSLSSSKTTSSSSLTTSQKQKEQVNFTIYYKDETIEFRSTSWTSTVSHGKYVVENASNQMKSGKQQQANQSNMKNPTRTRESDVKVPETLQMQTTPTQVKSLHTFTKRQVSSEALNRQRQSEKVNVKVSSVQCPIMMLNKNNDDSMVMLQNYKDIKHYQNKQASQQLLLNDDTTSCLINVLNQFIILRNISIPSPQVEEIRVKVEFHPFASNSKHEIKEKRTKATYIIFNDYPWIALSELYLILPGTFSKLLLVISIYIWIWGTTIALVLLIGTLTADSTMLHIWFVFNIIYSLLQFMIDDWIHSNINPPRSQICIWLFILYSVYKPGSAYIGFTQCESKKETTNIFKSVSTPDFENNLSLESPGTESQSLSVQLMEYDDTSKA